MLCFFLQKNITIAKPSEILHSAFSALNKLKGENLMKKVLKTERAPGAIGPYSQGAFSDKLLFLSGQIALTAEGELRTDRGVAEQTELIMKNISALLAAAFLDFENIVKTTIFLTDMNDFDEVNGVYGQFFGEKPPARSTVAVAALPKGARVEIECVAVLNT